METRELKFGEQMFITHSIEVLIVDLSFDNETGTCGLSDVVDDFLEFLNDSDIQLDLESRFEASKFYTVGDNFTSLGVKFDFCRLMKGTVVTCLAKKKNGSKVMGDGTQWVNDIVSIMKEFLIYMQNLDKEYDSEAYTSARLIFRMDGKQFEWK